MNGYVEALEAAQKYGTTVEAELVRPIEQAASAVKERQEAGE